MARWWQYLLAFLVLAHGFVYLRIGPVMVDTVGGWTGRSWLLGSAIKGPEFRALVIGLHLFAGVMTVACGITIAFGPGGWWAPMAVLGGAAGVAAFAAFWDGQRQRLFDEGAIGAAISAVLLVIAVAFQRGRG